jgi:ferredoxin
LREWGVPDKHVFFEAFGPATVKRVSAPAPGNATLLTTPVDVSFSRSGKACKWNSGAGTLLELAEANGVTIEAGCRAGNCGTCLVAIKSGDVEYLAGHGAPAEEHSCLTCICQPKSNLVLDA